MYGFEHTLFEEITMRRLLFILLAASLSGLGCTGTGKKPQAPTQPSGRNNTAPFWSEERSPKNAETKSEPVSDGMLAGRLIDNSGQPQANALVNVTPANAGPNAKPIGIQADDQGFFMIKGLSSGTTYFLSVRGEDRGKVLGGAATVQAPNTRLLIRLSENNVSSVTPAPQPSPGVPAPFVTPKKDDSKPKLADPKMSIPSPDPAPAKDPLTGSDQSWGPGKAPPPITPLPPPPPAAKNNPNVADSNDRPWPPPAAVPGPVSPVIEPPPPSASPSMSAVPSNSSPMNITPTIAPPGPRISFTLYDGSGNPVEFSQLTDRRLLVLDFWSTTCMPCLRKIPDLIDLQNRYASYVEIAGVACDDLPWDKRRKAVDGVRDYYLRKTPKPINYGIWYEGEGQEGRVQNQFKIKAYPTMILLDHTGRELWRGSDVRQLEEAIKYSLMRK